MVEKTMQVTLFEQGDIAKSFGAIGDLIVSNKDALAGLESKIKENPETIGRIKDRAQIATIDNVEELYKKHKKDKALLRKTDGVRKAIDLNKKLKQIADDSMSLDEVEKVEKAFYLPLLKQIDDIKRQKEAARQKAIRDKEIFQQKLEKIAVCEDAEKLEGARKNLLSSNSPYAEKMLKAINDRLDFVTSGDFESLQNLAEDVNDTANEIQVQKNQLKKIQKQKVKVKDVRKVVFISPELMTKEQIIKYFASVLKLENANRTAILNDFADKDAIFFTSEIKPVI